MPTVLNTSIFNLRASSDVEDKIFRQLESINEIKHAQIDNFFTERRGDIEVLANIIPFLDEADYDVFFPKYIEQYGYYDLFLIDRDGFVHYTVAKEADYQTNILNGRYAGSNLGSLVSRVMDSGQYGIVDYRPYAPSNDEPAAFIALPVQNGDMVVALQISQQGIQRIMSVRDGMGETGESYLVGSDKRMRSDSYLDPAGRSIKASFAGTVAKNGVDTSAVQRALNGESGVDLIVDYNGNEVLSAYAPVRIGDFTWVILSEIDAKEAFASIEQTTYISVILITVSSLVIALIGLLISSKLAAPIIAASTLAEKVAEGKLTDNIEVTAHDEVGQLQRALVKMVENLRTMVSQLTDISIQQGTTADELAAVTEQTSAAVTEQQAQTTQAVTATNQMSATIREIASTTSNASTVCEEVLAQAKEGATHIETTYDALVDLGQTTQSTADQINKLRQDSDQVVKVLGVIKQIAEQTNLLALNAAIEAARAGEHGRGFAVVADEVRHLAQSTQASTTEIEQIIDAIVQGTNGAVSTMETNVEQTARVQEIANQANQINQLVSQEVSGINDMVMQIAAATEEQTSAIDEISQSIEFINTGVTETEKATRNVADSSHELSLMAHSLTTETKKFTL
ncbi:methyl-accepting chemotaxis protein [Ferrimonas sp.]|uniref:methyl-accepting chemotaxis protein n=1 Tax=Ferrimonas sp. TaxID=2080861 RepID=UPI003A8E41F1